LSESLRCEHTNENGRRRHLHADPRTTFGLPGSRAPHVWLGDGVSIFDRFGSDFTLVRFNPRAASDAIEAAAKKRGMPLATIDVTSDEARNLYARDLVLVRPDHHVAWRGNSAPADAEALLARVAGQA